MITRPNNWENVKAESDRKTLVNGAYICRTIKAETEQTKNGGVVLKVAFDITEGEYKNFFREEFDSNTIEGKKWKGTLRLFLPMDDGTEADEFRKRQLKGLVTAFEESNPGYKFNWDESTLANKNIGILTRNEEWEYNGKSGWAVRPFKALSVQAVRDGKYHVPKDKPLTDAKKASANVGYTNVTNSVELPF